MSCVCFAEYGLPRLQHCVGIAVMDRGGREQAEPPVVMLVVLPSKECRGEALGMFKTVEAFGELRPILHGLELALGERVVVGNVRATMRLDDAQSCQHLRDGL